MILQKWWMRRETRYFSRGLNKKTVLVFFLIGNITMNIVTSV
jgi:hypothetical protein